MHIKKNMYVRCPLIDRSHPMDPRDFVMGKVVSVDAFAEKVNVVFEDPFKYRTFYPHVPKNETYPLPMISHCEIYYDSKVIFNKVEYRIVRCVSKKDEQFDYYIRRASDNKVICVKEGELTAGFINGWVSPQIQLKNYEFQNPSWYLGRSVVNKTSKILSNSIMGFKELAGCKIFLMPHQLNTVMRCLQEKPCRYMLADEVGMGKTIEATSVLKLFLLNNGKKKVLILAPESLKEQWKVELFLKFGIDIGLDINSNQVVLKSMRELNDKDLSGKWDFVVCDEVHRLLRQPSEYAKFHTISREAENVLLLSATPLQKKTEDYLKLLRILDPTKYDIVKVDKFKNLAQLQSAIINSIITVLDNVENIREDIEELGDIDPHDDVECKELFENVIDGLEEIQDLIRDDTYSNLIVSISFDAKDLGIQGMQVAISYICDNYQLERHIIRNRRSILFNDETIDQVRPVRRLFHELSYQAGSNEYAVYQRLVDLIELDPDKSIDEVAETYSILLHSYFSSAAAFDEELQKPRNHKFKNDADLNDLTEKWRLEEADHIKHITDYYDDPDARNDRFTILIDYLDQELYKSKVILFTSFTATFWKFQAAFEKAFNPTEVCYFCKDMDTDDLELNAYRFQNEQNCRILLCDKTGGEGRNFQIADYIIHIDIPWDANEIEQRIGRLDRLGRDPERPEVNSIVIYEEDTFEQQLFLFWNKGLRVFQEPLCGLEIILEEINRKIYTSIVDDFRYGLYNAVPQIVDTAQELKKEIRREQLFDTIGYLYRPMNNELNKLIRYYNQNENELFSRTMMNWASLAGFNPYTEYNTITFKATSFSIESAKNTLLIPPDWTAYLLERRTNFTNRIQELYNAKKNAKTHSSAQISGTFDRKTAISNDYLHFFAPGDDIYDCIINNAIKSTKGQCAAFFLKSEINWQGFIYSFSAEVNEQVLYENEISPLEVSYFRYFLSSQIVDIPVGRDDYADVPDSLVLAQYNAALKMGYKEIQTDVDHLGRRGSKNSGFVNISSRYGVSNLEWFKSKFPKDAWNEVVDNTYSCACKKVISEISKQSHLRGAKEEIQRIVAARIASDKYYGRTETDYIEIEKKYNTILYSLKHPKIRLESASFVWMVRN